MKNFEIEPLKGFGDIKFGMSIDEVTDILGVPSNNEELESLVEGSANSSVLYDYDENEMSVCFEGVEKSVVVSISTYNEDAVLFGKRVYEMSRAQIVDMMRRNGYKEFDEEEQEGDVCLIYDELMLDFYFNQDELIDVVWGV